MKTSAPLWREKRGESIPSFDTDAELDSALTVDGTANGKRPAQIPGDLVFGGKLLDDWGMHLIDMNVVMGNLLETVRRQGGAYVAR
ncbi:MAG: hypothetical protein ACXWB8_12070 [Ramlibacter sp.]